MNINVVLYYICQWSFPTHSTPYVFQPLFDLLITNVILFVRTANNILQNYNRVTEIVSQLSVIYQ